MRSSALSLARSSLLAACGTAAVTACLTAPAWAASASVAATASAAAASGSPVPSGCSDHHSGSQEAGLKLPPGFCVTVFADHIGHARHLVVAPTGEVYVNTWSGRYYGKSPIHEGGFLVVLRDTHGKGIADVSERFGDSLKTGGAGGTGIGLSGEWLYAELNDKIVRYRLQRGSLVPSGAAQTIVSGLPLSGDHPMHPFIIEAGHLYVDVGTATNSCQFKNRSLKSPGIDPCVELETRGGIWRFDANQEGQIFSAGQRYATGIRNGEGLAVDADHRIFVTQHGRDQLHANWPNLYKPEEEATLPAEEVMLLGPGGDYGWPGCYYDPVQGRLVLAPEYGGDGGKSQGPCASKRGPVAAFPAHWAPNDMVYYDRPEFPVHYRRGLFIAFHGSWDRAPYGQQGYNVVFQPMDGDHPSGKCEIFADGFAGPSVSPGTALHRPSGLGVGPDGALYVSDDVSGRIYRIVYVGGEGSVPEVTPCPDPAAGPGPLTAVSQKPPEGTDPNAGTPPPVPPGATAAVVALGGRIYRGEVGGAACTGCHGNDGAGTSLGPNLRSGQWAWSDGSVDGIAATITRGVAEPKQFRSPMPALGGAQLLPDEVHALAAFVWGFSHAPASGAAR